MTAVGALRDTLDFPIAAEFRAADAGELAGLLAGDRDGRRVRLCGRAGQMDRLPAPDRPGEVVLARLDAMDRILRLEPGDLTCSVEPGVTRAALDAALAPHRLCLPCPPPLGDADRGDATLGGLFAAGRATPRLRGGFGARSLLLGLTGVLGDGRRFRAGARVVKSVAGFDVPKLFVGSRGRAFAAVELHLKLRPLPRARAAFRRDALDAASALALWHRLAIDREPPADLVAARAADGSWRVVGAFEGHPTVVAARLAAHDLPRADAPPDAALLDAPADAPRLTVALRPSRIAALVDALPADAPLCCDGAGALLVALPADRIDATLATVAALGGAAEQTGGDAASRGRATPPDPGAARVTARLRESLDPDGVFV